MNAPEKLFIVYPGHMHSRTDGDDHYIGAGKLFDLYGVQPSECIVHDWENEPTRYPIGHDPEYIDCLMELKPLYSGAYTKVTAEDRNKVRERLQAYEQRRSAASQD